LPSLVLVNWRRLWERRALDPRIRRLHHPSSAREPIYLKFIAAFKISSAQLIRCCMIAFVAGGQRSDLQEQAGQLACVRGYLDLKLFLFRRISRGCADV
jgi:hypothetical protein